jgi:hypothetical protein
MVQQAVERSIISHHFQSRTNKNTNIFCGYLSRPHTWPTCGRPSLFDRLKRLMAPSATCTAQSHSRPTEPGLASARRGQRWSPTHAVVRAQSQMWYNSDVPRFADRGRRSAKSETAFASDPSLLFRRSERWSHSRRSMTDGRCASSPRAFPPSPNVETANPGGATWLLAWDRVH